MNDRVMDTQRKKATYGCTARDTFDPADPAWRAAVLCTALLVIGSFVLAGGLCLLWLWPGLD